LILTGDDAVKINKLSSLARISEGERMTQEIGPAATQGRLLVLDDDTSVSFTICAIAQKSGFDTRSTVSSDEFFELVSSWQPTHMVVDLVMPDVDGVETLHRLAKTKSESIVIVTSGLGGRVLEAAGRAATENGLTVSGILPKPFAPALLRELLSHKPGASTARINKAAPSPDAFQITEHTLSEALANDQLEVYYQPKIDCAIEALTGFESLVRWSHPHAGMIYPDSFITMAERTGQISELTRQVFEKSLAWFSGAYLHTDLQLSINMSPVVLADAEFPNWVLNACQRYQVHPDQITLEITETSSMKDPVAMLEYLTQFRIKGFSLSIDDFGVGYSSLVQLARLPFSEMKIDKMFVMSAATSVESQKITAAIIGLAKALDLTVTAEGVEDLWTLQLLRDLGCDKAQGYYIGRPMPETQIAEWIHNYRGTGILHV